MPCSVSTAHTISAAMARSNCRSDRAGKFLTDAPEVSCQRIVERWQLGGIFQLEFRRARHDYGGECGNDLVAGTGNRQSCPHVQYAELSSEFPEEQRQDHLHDERRKLLRRI